MRRPGPLYTLIFGLLATMVIAMFGRTGVTAQASAPAAVGTPRVTPSAAPTPTASPSAKPAAKPSAKPASTTRKVYAARIPALRAVIGVVVTGGSAIAYVCDGRRLEAWLRGKVNADGSVVLTGPGGQVVAAVGDRFLGGAVQLKGGDPVGFSAPPVRPPSGLYRLTATLRGAKVVGGWIVTPDGRQVGVVKVGTSVRSAPAYDPGTDAVEVDGERLPVAPADPAAP
ncbi:hypothetical protein [Rhizohabitans arisaemae]|uniref:hypothetical protein n=1 Tax=Rhizohabitans arisaemae TaxID=2720610 RepID=UPI0024B171BC|nr:hypothetical protein [Rhizohabitans arisaemae]